MPVLDQVEFAAYECFEVSLFGLGYKLKGTEHISVVGDRDPLLTIGYRLIHHCGDMGGAIEEGIMRMAVEMNEIRHIAK